MSRGAKDQTKGFLFVCLALSLVLNLGIPPGIYGQVAERYYFSTAYTLPGQAANLPGNYLSSPQSKFQQFRARQSTPDFKGYELTDVIDDFMVEPLNHDFAIEFSIVHHFNKPGGLVFFLTKNKEPNLSFGYFAEKDRMPFEIEVNDFVRKQILYRDTLNNFYQKYWHHFIIKYHSGSMILFHNGEKLSEFPTKVDLDGSDLKIAAYLQNEPFSKLQNIVSYLSIYRVQVNELSIGDLYRDFQNKLDEGSLFFDTLHFNAGPYLHFATDSSINLVWETNRPSKTILEYGVSLPLSDNMIVRNDKATAPFIYETTISGLNPDQKYFYNLKVTSETGAETESGVLTFKTGIADAKPILFGLIGDTETRPHVNDIIAKGLWAERPEFVVLLGDLTDGGMQNAKWQWNLEYFTGMNQLFSRIGVFPVPGNGEGDLYWYTRYHKLPGNEAYYSFDYSDASFYMLNSNEREREFSPGGTQYMWLDSALTTSDKRWKFVALHHAPYSTDENDYGNTYTGSSNLGDEHVQPLIPVFEKHKVDAVFFGHLHSYNRIGPIRNGQFNQQGGIWYIQTGGAGGNLEDFAPTREWFSQKTYAGHHYCTVALLGDHMHLKTYNLQGELIDFMMITK